MRVDSVSDEVWAQLGELARVDEREARVLRRSAVAVAALLVLAVCVWGLGLVSPPLDHGNSSGSTVNTPAHTAQYDFDLINRGLWPVSVVGVSTNLPGVLVTSTTPRSLQVPKGSSRHLRIALQIQDCTAALKAVRNAAESDTPPLRVLVSRPWGTVASRVRPPDQSWIADLVLYACGQQSL